MNINQRRQGSGQDANVENDSYTARAAPATTPVKSGKTQKREIASCNKGGECDEYDGSCLKKRKVLESGADSALISNELTEDKKEVFEFLSQSDLAELQTMPCSVKKAKLILENRPFRDWTDMVEKFQRKGGPGDEVLKSAQKLVQTRELASELIKQCRELSSQMEAAIAAGLSNVQSKPSIMSNELKLADYQLAGLNWLLALDTVQVNGMLADEMGLGKTLQIIAFLSYLKEKQKSALGKPHLIVVPASTYGTNFCCIICQFWCGSATNLNIFPTENWQNEFSKFSPNIKVRLYSGDKVQRKRLRQEWFNDGYGDTEVVLTTYSTVATCPEGRSMFRTLPLHYAVFDEAHMVKNMTSQRYGHLINIHVSLKNSVRERTVQSDVRTLKMGHILRFQCSLLDFATWVGLRTAATVRQKFLLWKQWDSPTVEIVRQSYSLIFRVQQECGRPAACLRIPKASPLTKMSKNTSRKMWKNVGTLQTVYNYLYFVCSLASNRVLVTGTPIQNNLLELVSLLAFLMPKMFEGKHETLKLLFASKTQRNENDSESTLSKFERTQIFLSKEILKPFVLRRLKSDVLKDIPQKTCETIQCFMTEDQEKKYNELAAKFSKEDKDECDGDDSVKSVRQTGMYMKLRRLANHPLLLRYHFEDKILEKMEKLLLNDMKPLYSFEELCVMSDFELHKICLENKTCDNLRLSPSFIGESGKFRQIEKLLPKLFEEGHKVLMFSQFLIVLDILEEFLKQKMYKYLRFDGTTSVALRQGLVDEFSRDPSIRVFLSTTRAGGLGVNLTAADVVIIHDVDSNPQNDKQAEDRCHRIGQSKPVKIIRLISKNTIEERIHNVALGKLALEKDVSSNEERLTCKAALGNE
ncbi:SWI/SNF-related matrix-associated actin-dependent regulator of chromatin subfamily A containing DEAD/H box 1 homolog [Frankliniella occidentalis]|uniref:SWI/SNF-related matrix-associated actin-dependent regulator of chromatin subfamily A containing DEAD/H box 1 homolog n=1 Tax=Frankliniella occidentalis TaxID=133901 RepID=A0A9C6U7V8_FRAOC|nr:SWI/SNF-related matrix-associated actin-dependent regulator of chromatin subfamily A containing DEAD/H box 1 homolog [Frankliniella occidentalis]